MALESPAWVISASSHSAALFRQTAQTLLGSSGVVATPGIGGLSVVANGTPNMTVNVATGLIWIPGSLGATSGFPSGFTAQGSYCAYNDGTVNLGIAAADPTNPRIDLVCASIQDAQYAGSNNQPVLQVVTGTAAPSPSAPAAPASTVILAQVQVAAAATSITSGNISDQRTWVVPYGSGPMFVGYQTTGQSIGANTWTAITLDTTSIDTYSGHSNTVNNTRYTVQVPGWYYVFGMVSLAAGTGIRYAALRYNGVAIDQFPASSTNAAASIPNEQYAIGLNYMPAGAYVELGAYTNSAVSTSVAAGGQLSMMGLWWVHS